MRDSSLARPFRSQIRKQDEKVIPQMQVQFVKKKSLRRCRRRKVEVQQAGK